MENNDILRRIRYVFDYSEPKMAKIFSLADYEVTREEVSDWLKKDDEEGFQKFNDKMLAIFLNGLITEKRGKKDGPVPIPEKHLSNNTGRAL